MGRATSFLSSFKRAGRIPGVVDYVASGSRFKASWYNLILNLGSIDSGFSKIFIPKQEVKITLVLSGIRSPRSGGRPNEKPEPFGQEALDFTTRKTLQRDVEIIVQETDRSGGFIGALYLNKTENFATILVKEGFAYVNENSAGQLKELKDAEAEAKSHKRNVSLYSRIETTKNSYWTVTQLFANYDPQAEASAQMVNGGTEVVKPSQELIQIMVSDIRSEPFGLSIQVLNNGGKLFTFPKITTSNCLNEYIGIPELEKLMSDFSLYHRTAPSASATTVYRTGDLVSAKFSIDQAWYRAKILKSNSGKRLADVQFIDYGNKETLNFNDLRPLSDQFRKLPHQARDGLFSFIEIITATSDYAGEAYDRLHQLLDVGICMIHSDLYYTDRCNRVQF